MPPPLGLVKVNFDGSSFSNLGYLELEESCLMISWNNSEPIKKKKKIMEH